MNNNNNISNSGISSSIYNINCNISYIIVLVRGLHSLSRIGDELYIESLDNSLSFRTVNSAQSAYSSVTFYTSFFIHYKSDFKSDEGGKCKLSMKVNMLLSYLMIPYLNLNKLVSLYVQIIFIML